jgi:hypothetical protein
MCSKGIKLTGAQVEIARIYMHFVKKIEEKQL